MRNEIEQMFTKYGSYWVIALFAVVVAKMFSKEPQTIRTVVRSLLGSIIITILIVENAASTPGIMFCYVVVGGILTDVIFESTIAFGVKVKEDPSILFKYVPWLRGKDK